jgi:hypothetical protein
MAGPSSGKKAIRIHAVSIIFLYSALIPLSLQNIGAAPKASSSYTFYRDVLPILQNRCQVCHRPGEIGPMPLMTYAQTQPFARAIATDASQKKCLHGLLTLPSAIFPMILP